MEKHFPIKEELKVSGIKIFIRNDLTYVVNSVRHYQTSPHIFITNQFCALQ